MVEMKMTALMVAMKTIYSLVAIEITIWLVVLVQMNSFVELD